MNKKNSIALPLLLLHIFKDFFDSDHLISMADIQSITETQHLPSDRRTIYHAISVLRNYGYDIRFEFHKYYTGYYMVPYFEDTEQFILLDALNQIKTIPAEDIHRVQEKIKRLSGTKENIPLIQHRKTTDPNILRHIQTVLHAIQKYHSISFYYYDYTISKQKKYRKNKKRYTLVPYAVTSFEGKYYCVLYSPKYNSFANYRIDKMEAVAEINETVSTVSFDLQQHLQTSMKMYTGKTETITLNCREDMANQIFDEFGTEIIVSQSHDQHFIINIKTAVTPTLVSWLLQFYDRIEVLRPQSLQEHLVQMSKYLLSVYAKDTE